MNRDDCTCSDQGTDFSLYINIGNASTFDEIGHREGLGRLAMETIIESATAAIKNIGIQYVSFILIIAAAYYVPYFLMNAIRVPVGLNKFFSAAIMMIAIYYSFSSIFLSPI